MRPPPAAIVKGRACVCQRACPWLRTRLCSDTRTRAATLSVNAKAIWEIRGRLLLRATSARSVSASPESWMPGLAAEVGVPEPAGVAPAPLPVADPSEPEPPAPAVGAPPPPEGLDPPPPFSSEPGFPPPPSPGVWKAAIPSGVPTPVGPS